MYKIRSLKYCNPFSYAFNGKEKDDELKGSGNSYDYGMRIYDGRLGKFLSVDPLFREYPWNSSYAFAENDVVRSIDIDGAEKLGATTNFAKKSAPLLKIIFSSDVLKQTLIKDINKKDVESTLIIFATFKSDNPNLGGKTQDIGNTVAFIEKFETQNVDFQKQYQSKYDNAKKLIKDLDLNESQYTRRDSNHF